MKKLLTPKNFVIINKHKQPKKQQYYFESIRDNFQKFDEIR